MTPKHYAIYYILLPICIVVMAIKKKRGHTVLEIQAVIATVIPHFTYFNIMSKLQLPNLILL